MPTPADAPLRKVTLNLYEADVAYIQQNIKDDWSVYVRHLVRAHCDSLRRYHRTKRLGDLE